VAKNPLQDSMSPTPGLTATAPGFSPPSHQPPREDPIDPAATTIRQAPPQSPETDGGEAGYLDDGPSESSTTSRPPGSPLVSTPEAHKALTLLVREGVGAATTVLDERLSPGSHAWAATEWELDAIAEPLGRIAARHNPLAATPMLEDAADAIEAGVGLVGYGLAARRRSRDPILVVRQIAHQEIQRAIISEAETAVRNATESAGAEAVHRVAEAAVAQAVEGAVGAAGWTPGE
jgi:hypothetical protein